MSKKEKITIEELKAFEPISALSIERLEELQGLVDVEVLGVGVTLFREGDVDNQSVYLIEGDVQMTSVSDQSLNTMLTHKVNDAKHPLAEGQPRQLTCTAMTITKILRIDNSILDYMLTWDQLAVAEEVEKELEEEVKEEPAIEETLFIETQEIENFNDSAINDLSDDSLMPDVENAPASNLDDLTTNDSAADELTAKAPLNEC